MSKIHQIEDKFFKKSFGIKQVAKDFLARRLPEAIRKKIDLDTLENQNTSFISADMKAFYAYRVQGKGGDHDIYFLLKAEKEKDAALAEILLRLKKEKTLCKILSKKEKLIALINESPYGKDSMLYLLEKDTQKVDYIS